MRGKASLVFALSCVLVLLPSTLTSLAAHNAWSTRGLPGCCVQTLAINPAVSHRLYPGTDRGFLWPRWLGPMARCSSRGAPNAPGVACCMKSKSPLG